MLSGILTMMSKQFKSYHMKITLLKTSKQNRQHLQSVPMETMIQTVMSNQVADDVEDLRQFVKWAESWKEYERTYRYVAENQL